MADPLITEQQCIDRLSLPVALQLFDDNNTGIVNSAPMLQFRKDASSKVRGALGPVYDTILMTEAYAAEAEELRRITLDVFQAMVALRHPDTMRFDGLELMKQANLDLKNLRTGVSNLGTQSPPEPAANHGGVVVSGDPDYPDDIPNHVFLNGTGDY